MSDAKQRKSAWTMKENKKSLGTELLEKTTTDLRHSWPHRDRTYKGSWMPMCMLLVSRIHDLIFTSHLAKEQQLRYNLRTCVSMIHGSFLTDRHLHYLHFVLKYSPKQHTKCRACVPRRKTSRDQPLSDLPSSSHIANLTKPRIHFFVWQLFGSNSTFGSIMSIMSVWSKVIAATSNGVWGSQWWRRCFVDWW
jgi:hypothetical protein